MVVVLPLPLTPITSTTCGLLRRIDGKRRRHRLQDLGDVVGEGRAHLLVGHFLAEALLAELLDQAGGDADAEIGLDQRVLQLVERLLVELLLGEEAGDALGDALGRFGEAGAQPRQPALLLDFLSPRVGFGLQLRLDARSGASLAGSGSGVSLAGSPLERHRDSQPFFGASFSTLPSSGLGVSLTGPPHESSERSSSPLKATRDAAGHQHVVVAQPFDGERAALQDDVGLARHQAAPARRHDGRAGARAAGERHAGAALPDAQPQPALAQRAGRRRYWRARERSGRARASGRARRAGSRRASSTKNVACGLPMLVPTGSCSGPTPTGMWLVSQASATGNVAPVEPRRAHVDRDHRQAVAPMPVFCDSSRPAMVCTVTWSVLRSSITTEATQRVALPQAPASPPSGL